MTAVGFSAAGIAALLSAAGAAAQERLDLRGGFAPDPVEVAVVGGGGTPAADWVRGCPGALAEAPALTVLLTAPDRPLNLVLAGEG